MNKVQKQPYICYFLLWHDPQIVGEQHHFVFLLFLLLLFLFCYLFVIGFFDPCMKTWHIQVISL